MKFTEDPKAWRRVGKGLLLLPCILILAPIALIVAPFYLLGKNFDEWMERNP